MTKQTQDVDGLGQAGDVAPAQLRAALPAVEIPPEMLKAGVGALSEYAPLGDIDEDSLLLVAMARAVLKAALRRNRADWKSQRFLSRAAQKRELPLSSP